MFRKKEEAMPKSEYDDSTPRGTWESSGSMTDEEAHRDRTYNIPGQAKQTLYSFMTQMSLLSKRKSIYVTLVLAILIPVIYYLIRDSIDLTLFADPSGSGTMGILLVLMPLIMILLTSFLSAGLMPDEISERTAYMNMALPMSRTSFCLGKYLASLVVCIGVFSFAYAMAMAASMIEYDFFVEHDLAVSYALMLLACVTFTSFAFAMGCFLKKGATILTLIIMLIAIPGAEIYAMSNGYIDSDTLMLIPNMLPDMACLSLGTDITGSAFGFINGLVSVAGLDGLLDVSSINLGLTTGITIAWCVAFLALGIFAVSRREM